MKRWPIFIHVDVDNIWVGESEWGLPPSGAYEAIYQEAMPRFLSLFQDFGIKATFFMIGKDLELPSCLHFCREAIGAGHRLGNHSFSHPQSFASLTYGEKKQEVKRTHELLTEITGAEPQGFRSPGYCLDQDLIQITNNMGYLYDSSRLPGWGTFLMSLFFRIRSAGREKVFGHWKDLFASRNAGRLRQSSQGTWTWEYPISIFPFLRLPVHMTFAYQFGYPYARLALSMLKFFQGPHLYLFHAVDLLKLPAACTPFKAHWPAFSLPLPARYRMVKGLLSEMAESFTPTLAEDFASQARINNPAMAGDRHLFCGRSAKSRGAGFRRS